MSVHCCKHRIIFCLFYFENIHNTDKTVKPLLVSVVCPANRMRSNVMITNHILKNMKEIFLFFATMQVR